MLEIGKMINIMAMERSIGNSMKKITLDNIQTGSSMETVFIIIEMVATMMGNGFRMKGPVRVSSMMVSLVSHVYQTGRMTRRLLKGITCSF
jgi:hypothetical protein